MENASPIDAATELEHLARQRKDAEYKRAHRAMPGALSICCVLALVLLAGIAYWERLILIPSVLILLLSGLGIVWFPWWTAYRHWKKAVQRKVIIQLRRERGPLVSPAGSDE